MSNGTNRINVSSIYACKVLTEQLKQRNISRHSYENKNNRDIRVLMRNVPSNSPGTTNTECYA